MVSEYLKEIIRENIKDGVTTIYIKYVGLNNFIDIKVNFLIGIEFDCLVYTTKTNTRIEREYIPVDKIVHISFEKKN